MASRFESINFIEIYEINGTEEKGLRSHQRKVRVREHWNRQEFVVLQIDEGTEVTVLASQLVRAIENAQNAHGY